MLRDARLRMAPREAVVLAGGFGTRLAHEVPGVCKPMAPVVGRPFLRYVLDGLAERGFARVVIADGYLREQIEGFFGGAYRGMEIAYSPECEPLGTGGALRRALGLCRSEWVYALNGDTLFDFDCLAMEEAALCADEGVLVVMAVKPMRDFDRYGTVRMAADGEVCGFEEKRPCASGLINGGAYLMRRDVLAGEPERFGMEAWLERHAGTGALRAVVCDGEFVDIGVAQDYRRAQSMLKPRAKAWKLAIFDRDGTINVDTGHLFEPDKLALIPETVAILRACASDPDCKVVVVTNQAGIAKGLYSVEHMRELHRELDARLAALGCRIDAYYFCPHHPDYTGECPCRKPAPGMLLAALRDFDANPQDCIMYGDKKTDRLAAEAAGIRFEWVKQELL